MDIDSSSIADSTIEIAPPSHRFTVMVTGKEKAGKTSYIGALLGIPLYLLRDYIPVESPDRCIISFNTTHGVFSICFWDTSIEECNDVLYSEESAIDGVFFLIDLREDPEIFQTNAEDSTVYYQNFIVVGTHLDECGCFLSDGIIGCSSLTRENIFLPVLLFLKMITKIPDLEFREK